MKAEMWGASRAGSKVVYLVVLTGNLTAVHWAQSMAGTTVVQSARRTADH